MLGVENVPEAEPPEGVVAPRLWVLRQSRATVLGGRHFLQGPLLDSARSSRLLANPRDEEVHAVLKEPQVHVQTDSLGLGGSTGRENLVAFSCQGNGHFWATSYCWASWK